MEFYSILYNRIEYLCRAASLTVTDLCRNLSITRGNLSDLKKGRQKSLSAETLGKIAVFFNVPLSFFSELPPFDCWELIEANRRGFMHYVNIPAEIVDYYWHVDTQNPDACSVVDFIKFLAGAIDVATPTSEGDWDIQLSGAAEGSIEASHGVSMPTLDPERMALMRDIESSLRKLSIEDLRALASVAAAYVAARGRA